MRHAGLAQGGGAIGEGMPVLVAPLAHRHTVGQLGQGLGVIGQDVAPDQHLPARQLGDVSKGPNPAHVVADSFGRKLPRLPFEPELDPQPGDVISSRVHGLSPFTATSLDITLRNLGVRTVVATGVSLNIGVFGLVLEAVNLGYSVVLPTDCVTGVPAGYAADIVQHSLSLMATCVHSDQLVELWS